MNFDDLTFKMYQFASHNVQHTVGDIKIYKGINSSFRELRMSYNLFLKGDLRIPTRESSEELVKNVHSRTVLFNEHTMCGTYVI